MPAMDTVLYDVHNATGAPIGLTGATVAVGDSATVRYFPSTNPGYLEYVAAQASGTRQARVASPLLHDNSTGLTFSFSEQPTHFLLPKEVGQPVVAGDTLAVSINAAATSDSIAALGLYYTSLPGASARLFSWGDIAGIVKSVKAVQVAITTSATIGQWVDAAITVTEDQLHARSDYAILGYETDTALGVITVKGQETGNLRIGGPGPTSTLDTSDYFVRMTERHGRPHIPVFNADNRKAYYVSAAANTASVAANVTLILAELTQQLPGATG